MDVINTILEWIVSALSTILPVFNLDPQFVAGLDSGIATIISIINGAGYFIPLGTLSICLGIIFVFDNFSIFMRIAQWIIGLIRG